MKRLMFIVGLLMSVLLFSALAQAQYNEAPMLKQLVDAGKLPPVSERVPKNPFVLEVENEIGKYGGTWHRAFFGTGSTRPLETVSHEPLVWRKSAQDLRVVPNVAEKWEWSDEGRTVTFYLREGMKWSDGAPFTADDIMFWWNDVVNYTTDPTKKPVPPKWLVINNERPVFEKVNEYAFSITFPVHNGLMMGIATQNTAEWMMPAHYGKKFHPKYAKPEDFGLKTRDELYNLFLDKIDYGDRFFNPERPTLDPWMPVRWDVGEKVTMERNPYFWKVDPQGNQLPYIDRVEHQLVENVEVLNLKVVAGEVDFQIDNLSMDNYSLYVENEQRGGYVTGTWATDRTAVPIYWVNFQNRDPVMNDLIWKLDFRKALSYAIDREEINELVWHGQAVPMAPTVFRGSPYFQEGMDQEYIEFDPKLANKLLDGLGLTQRDSEGYRLRPDGKRLALHVLAKWPPDWPEHIPTHELVKEYWKDIGVEFVLEAAEGSLRNIRMDAAQWDIGTHNLGGTVAPWANPHWWAPVDGEDYAPLAVTWYKTNGKEGEPPIGMFKEALDQYEAIRIEQDEEKQLEMIKELVKRPIDNLWYIGTVGETPDVWVRKTYMKNIPEKGVVSWRTRVDMIANPEQFYIDK